MTIGKIIILNGIPSSGKSSIISVLQNILEEPYLESGLDKFLGMLPNRYYEPILWNQVFGLDEANKIGWNLISGMDQAIAVLSKAGNNTLVDHVIWSEQWLKECAYLFFDLPAYFIGVHCPLDVAEKREKTRINRTVGQAQARYPKVHQNCIYDYEVDTSKDSPENCAIKIKERIQNGVPPMAFKKIKSNFESVRYTEN